MTATSAGVGGPVNVRIVTGSGLEQGDVIVIEYETEDVTITLQEPGESSSSVTLDADVLDLVMLALQVGRDKLGGRRRD